MLTSEMRVRIKSDKKIEGVNDESTGKKGKSYQLYSIYENNYKENGILWKMYEVKLTSNNEEYIDTSLTIYAYESNLLEITNNNTMNPIQKFITSLKKEPQKSFIKTGITDNDEIVTPDGMKVFVSWLLTKHGDEFKADIVDAMLEEMKEDKK